MSNILYPNGIPYPDQYGTAQLIFPLRRDQLLLQRLYQLLHLRFLFCLFAALFFVTKTSMAQGPCAGSNCTSGDIRITKVELLNADGSTLPNSCSPGSNLQVKLRVTFDVTSKTRYGF